VKRLISSVLVFFFCTIAGQAAPTLGGPISPDGKVTVTISLPLHLRARNAPGIDGAGLCVFTSIMHSARWQLEQPLVDFQARMRKELGGGWPGRVDKMIAKYAPGVDYVQFEGRDPLLLKAALASQRLPSVTYNGRDPHYHGSISHMVNIVHLDDHWACILDNNFIGENDLVWMTPAEFLDRWRGRGSGWVVVLLREPPNPPVIGRVRSPESGVRSPARETLLASESGVRSPDLNLGGWQYTWFYHEGDAGRIYLYCEDDDDPTGAYDVAGRYFRFYHADSKEWLSKTEPPFPPPVLRPGQRTGVLETFQDFGVPLNQFPPRQPNEERWTRQGKAATKDNILAILLPRPRPQPQPDPLQPAPTPNPTSNSGPALLASLLMLVLFAIHVLPQGKQS
jgi:hypothetical protein